MSKRRLHLAAYDVSEPDRLRDMLETVKTYATGGQKSVFECWLTESERDELLDAVGRILDVAEDRFFLLQLDTRTGVKTLGRAIRPSDPEFYYVG